jgi:hypothetical protein
LDNELKQLDCEIQEQERLINVLTLQLKDLKTKKKKLIEFNCEHIYKLTGFCKAIDDKMMTEVRCSKCNKTAYYEGILIHEVCNVK